jgi:hypothetical protein
MRQIIFSRPIAYTRLIQEKVYGYIKAFPAIGRSDLMEHSVHHLLAMNPWISRGKAADPSAEASPLVFRQASQRS